MPYFSVYNGSGAVDTERVAFCIYAPEDLGGTDFCAEIVHVKTEKMLTDAADASVDVCNAAGDAAQVWQFIKNRDGSYKITNSKTGKDA